MMAGGDGDGRAAGGRRAAGGWGIMAGMMEMMGWTLISYLQAGAYVAIMIAVFGGPQMLSSYFEARNRRADRVENESNAERRHREALEAEARREERRLEAEARQEERRLEEERRQEERREERRLEERREERLRQEELRRQEAEAAERRHQELMAALIAAIGNGRDRGDDQGRLVDMLRQRVEALEVENARLRQWNGEGGSSPREHLGDEG